MYVMILLCDIGISLLICYHYCTTVHRITIQHVIQQNLKYLLKCWQSAENWCVPNANCSG